MDILDFIFPKRCILCKRGGSYLCENCFLKLSFDAKSLCLICNKPSYNNLTHPICLTKNSIDGCFSALSYNKTAQKLIYSFKYKPYLTDLKNVLGDLFYESIIQNENFNNELKKGNWIFVPLPLFLSKLKKRGYNQSEILGKVLSKKFNFKTINILKRTRDTKTQVGLSNIDRKLNIKDAFQIQNSEFKLQNVFLVDDDVTTGSTLKEAAKILKKNGAKRVIGLTLARD
ncbi:MAG TPA: ComF family protein [Candidatus Sulfotelmatobacter sp.]|nr:ComF family protein [Candidatus Sulfotelmatobacter sp.]